MTARLRQLAHHLGRGLLGAVAVVTLLLALSEAAGWLYARGLWQLSVLMRLLQFALTVAVFVLAAAWASALLALLRGRPTHR